MDDRFLQVRIFLADERLRCWIEALKLLHGHPLALEAVYERIAQERQGLWELHTQLVEQVKADHSQLVERLEAKIGRSVVGPKP